MIFTRKQTEKMSSTELGTNTKDKIVFHKLTRDNHNPFTIMQNFGFSVVHVGWERQSDGKSVPLYTAVDYNKNISSNSHIGAGLAILDLFLQLPIKETHMNFRLTQDIHESAEQEDEE